MIQHAPLKLHKDAEIALLTLDRPEVFNALDAETVVAALSIFRELQDDSKVKVVVVTGAGKAFISGADIAEMHRKTPAQARAYSELGHTLMRTIEQLSKPVLAAINGYCLGGGMEVALVSDIRIASVKARFGLPETILGIIPGWGALPRATRLIGPAVTKELMFTGDIIDAPRALKIGLINRMVAHNDLLASTMEIAKKICRKSQFAVAQSKAVINASIDETLAEACAMETDRFVSCFEGKDHEEGMRAFLEKREPRFDNGL